MAHCGEGGHEGTLSWVMRVAANWANGGRVSWCETRGGQGVGKYHYRRRHRQNDRSRNRPQADQRGADQRELGELDESRQGGMPGGYVPPPAEQGAQAQPSQRRPRAGKDAKRRHAVPGGADDGAARDDGQQQHGRHAAVAPQELVVEGDDIVVRLLEADPRLAGRALEGAAAVADAARGFVLALGDPLQHAVLVGFEAAGARVDPGPVGLLGIGLEADEADVLRIAERC